MHSFIQFFLNQIWMTNAVGPLSHTWWPLIDCKSHLLFILIVLAFSCLNVEGWQKQPIHKTHTHQFYEFELSVAPLSLPPHFPMTFVKSLAVLVVDLSHAVMRCGGALDMIAEGRRRRRRSLRGDTIIQVWLGARGLRPRAIVLCRVSDERWRDAVASVVAMELMPFARLVFPQGSCRFEARDCR